ncbi:glucose-6-phosphate isomerase family protein [Rubellimicrobium sp. CFH 75288]|uniref:glucose-6-phosphate isomerase family protein n=1 Tax=Rubellimicrobium sp. CFH 75288 TaxID=2697034 RepID=UPI001411F3A3|nr:glucose-6-phosphate isomerase family protein [Rubellimicrobium sp. CFH 75288]NAZ36348.1 glucose-6-phosphate isomerase [Rubellimicrobium sp. CFH 75288]
MEEPAAYRFDPQTGTLHGATGRYDKRLKDLAGLYADEAAFAEAVRRDGARTVYRVDEVRPPVAHGGLIIGTTAMEPGRIGREFFLTRGHIHAIPNRPETYRGESGSGVMLLESPEGDVRVLAISPGVTVVVPPFWIHRSVNTGADRLVMTFCYPADAGQDYAIIERAGGMRLRIMDDGAGGWIAEPNRHWRGRSAEEIKAIRLAADAPQDGGPG